MKRSSWSGGTRSYEDGDGTPNSRLIFRDEETSLEVASHDIGPWSFDGDGALLRLVSEADRIRLAHLFDPYLAVHTSRIEPLPHQITAVYGEMLMRQPLRFLLADDPGKTIMTGLFVKELMVRGDLERCLVVAPGNLVEQWQDELGMKFGLSFTILTRDRVEAAIANPFEDGLMIARLDMLSRNDDLKERLICAPEYDLIVVDEAHKMSASYIGGKAEYTKRYHLGQTLRNRCRHFLLLSATPHSGKQDDFELFMALLDEDRFEGKPRGDAGTRASLASTEDLMRRLVKEDLYTFDGRRLFPERHAYTVNYELSSEEKALYNGVTAYVREEMNRAERFAGEVDGDRRRVNVGFALTILQRRLASSPEAIYRSLTRRRERLEKRLADEHLSTGEAARVSGEQALPGLTSDRLDEEPGRYEIKHVPGAIRERALRFGHGMPVHRGYERIYFKKDKGEGLPPTAFVCPGHPLLDATIALILERYRDLLKRGAVLVDETDPGEEPRAMVYLEHTVQDGRASLGRDGKGQVVSRRPQFVELDATGNVRNPGPAPYLDYRPLREEERPLLKETLGAPWLQEKLLRAAGEPS